MQLENGALAITIPGAKTCDSLQVPHLMRRSNHPDYPPESDAA
jgi:hypothetical protein